MNKSVVIVGASGHGREILKYENGYVKRSCYFKSEKEIV